ncbi:MAG: hypothetical protein ABI400_09570 [Lacisediminihabitans sp.]
MLSAHVAVASAAVSSGETVRELQERIRQMQATKLDTRSIPTLAAFAEILPGGALKQGVSYSVEGSMTLLMALVAGPSAAGSWCGVIGVPEFGIEAAANFGIDLDRVAFVPYPGEHWLTVAAALADVLSVVVLRPAKRVSDGVAARLAARIRQRGATLIVVGAWPQSEAVLSLSESRWRGVGNGHGYLSDRQVTVTATTRSNGRSRSRKLWFPDADQQFRAETLSREVDFPAPMLSGPGYHRAVG